jgi:pimeloyl-ACP methyl ester carboxylesterase
MKRKLIRLLLGIACSALWDTTMAAGLNEAALPPSRTVTAQDGLNLVCEMRGQGDTALIFLHGWCGDRTYWKRQVDVFAPEYRVVTFDQAGHGQSGKDRKEWTAASLAGDVESVANALDLKRVVLVGHSMGGSIGLAAAKRMPGRVIAVIGVDTLHNAEFKWPEETIQKLLDGFTTNFPGTVRGMFTQLLPAHADRDLMEWLGAKAAAQDPKMAVALMRAIIQLDTKTLLREAKVPVRCINSAGGYPFYNPTAAETNRQYADYRAVLIEEVGHYPMLEKPTEFNRQLRAVLQEFRK